MADRFYIKSGDTGRSLKARLTGGDGVPQDLTGLDNAVRFRMRENRVGGALKVDRLATIVDALRGRVQYDWQAADVDTPGEYRGEFVVTIAPGQEITFPAGPPPDDFIRVVVQSSV